MTNAGIRVGLYAFEDLIIPLHPNALVAKSGDDVHEEGNTKLSPNFLQGQKGISFVKVI